MLPGPSMRRSASGSGIEAVTARWRDREQSISAETRKSGRELAWHGSFRQARNPPTSRIANVRREELGAACAAVRDAGYAPSSR